MADRFLVAIALSTSCLAPAFAAENVSLLDVPDYSWHAGCFGTASGNLMGYWDRHGFENMYTGPTAGGIAPLTSVGTNRGIRSLWASQAGMDGRPDNKPGHMDDYWEYFNFGSSFESTATDPYITLGRPEHEPDCLGDFIGQSQKKYSDLNGECSGNIDGFAFTYWDKTGDRLENFTPPRAGGVQVRDIPSGLRAFSRYRGYEADTYSQLSALNPTVSAGKGFTFEDLKREINAGYPVLLILQNYNEYSRALVDMPRANPNVHAMLAYGYVELDDGIQAVRFRSSWGDGDRLELWTAGVLEARMPLRGVITYHPKPAITKLERGSGQVHVEWYGPASVLLDESTGNTEPIHHYVVERCDSLTDGGFVPVSEVTTGTSISFPDSGGDRAFFRLKLVDAP